MIIGRIDQAVSKENDQRLIRKNGSNHSRSCTSAKDSELIAGNVSAAEAEDVPIPFAMKRKGVSKNDIFNCNAAHEVTAMENIIVHYSVVQKRCSSSSYYAIPTPANSLF
ncbi:Hypothetical predicted protein [Octopus vulgaris]|uniref:Uncharacterized protein n=1 Tax=Octopus vulgaris TaxID=6645 RepID=A0AA36F597_OCTVU|nr:Hypothetical predicted protein [Octopus vulgaris]